MSPLHNDLSILPITQTPEAAILRLMGNKIANYQLRITHRVEKAL
jgi:hypothetical protein